MWRDLSRLSVQGGRGSFAIPSFIFLVRDGVTEYHVIGASPIRSPVQPTFFESAPEPAPRKAASRRRKIFQDIGECLLEVDGEFDGTPANVDLPTYSPRKQPFALDGEYPILAAYV